MKLNLAAIPARPGVAIEVSRIGPLPDQPVPSARRDLMEPAPAVVQIVDESEDVLAGWPALVFGATVHGAGAPAAKLLVLMVILEYGAAIRMRCPLDAFADEKRELLRVLDGATIDWEEQLLTLSGIWEGIA